MAANGDRVAADFKERREPIEGRYGWILAVKDRRLVMYPLGKARGSTFPFSVAQCNNVESIAKHIVAPSDRFPPRSQPS
jgi:hypothetical protein